MTHQPPGTYHPPRADALTADHLNRTRTLEQRRPDPGYVPRFCLTASSVAPIAEPTTSHPWFAWRGAVDLEYVTIWASAATGASLAIRRAGVDVVTTDLDNGLTRLGVEERWTLGQQVDLVVSGEVGVLQVQMWFRGEGGGGVLFPGVGGDEG